MTISQAEYLAMQVRCSRSKRVPDSCGPVLEPTTQIIRATTDESKLNKTERAYLEHLRAEGHAWIGVQNITLKLADDTRYTPDFWLIDGEGLLCAREVKGFFRDDAKVKVKVAARQFPFARFSVVYRKGTGWSTEVVRP